jgi:hypothetical protein
MKNTTTAKNKSTLLIFAVLFTSVIIIMIVFRPGSSPIASAKSRYDSGYADGYAETYNTLCKNKAVNIEGDWSDKNYYEGYLAGQLSGASKCDAEKKAMLTK